MGFELKRPVPNPVPEVAHAQVSLDAGHGAGVKCLFLAVFSPETELGAILPHQVQGQATHCLSTVGPCVVMLLPMFSRTLCVCVRVHARASLPTGSHRPHRPAQQCSVRLGLCEVQKFEQGFVVACYIVLTPG